MSTTENSCRIALGDITGPMIVFVAFIGAWYGLAYSLHNNFAPNGSPILIPPPHMLFRGVGPVAGKIANATWLSARTSLIGLLLAIVFGMLFAILMSQARWIERAFYPYLVALQATPILALAPLIISVIGYNLKSRVLVAVILAIFPIVQNTLFGLLSADRLQHDLFSLHEATRMTRLMKLQLPAAMPSIFGGFRISAGLAVIGSIVGDFFFTRGEPGLGFRISEYFINNQPSRMFVCAILAALLGILFFVVFGFIANIAVGHWYEQTRKTAP